MFRLITLGAADLLGPDGNRVSSVVHQPKRFALLVYLSLATRGQLVRRDSILATFWPEKPDEEARHCLKQAGYHLRRSLGATALITEGGESLRINTDVLICDASDFEAAVAAGADQLALEAYKGDLLPGYHIAGSQEFDMWLEFQRSRLRNLATEAALRAAHDQRALGNPAGVGHWARRLAELGGTNETLVQDAIILLAESGDRAGAADVYARFERLLSLELDLLPSAETRSLAQQMTTRSDREGQNASVDAPTPISQASAEETRDRAPEMATFEGYQEAVLNTPPVQGGSARLSSIRLGKRLMAGLLAVLTLVFAAKWRSDSGSVALASLPADAYTALEVLEFEQIGSEEEVVLLARALSAATRRHLMGVRDIAVVSASLNTAGSTIPSSVYTEQGTGAGAFELGGAVRMNGVEIVVELILRSAESRNLIHAASLSHPASEVAGSIDSLARQIAWNVRTQLGRERRERRGRASAPDPSVASLVERAEAVILEARNLRGRRLTEAAAAGYMKADSLLAAAAAAAQEWSTPSVVRARAAAERAWLMLMPPLADRTIARTEFERSLAHAARAVSVGSDDPDAYEIRGTVAYWMWLTLDIDSAEASSLLRSAERDLKLAISMDPGRVRAWSLLSNMAHGSGDFTGAYWAASQGYRLDTYHENAQELLVRLFASSYEIGDGAAAEEWCTETNRRFGAGTAGTYCALALMAWRLDHDASDPNTAWSLIDELESPYTEMLVPRLEMMVASVLAGRGLRDSAEVVIGRARGRTPGDPELLHLEAHVRTVLGDQDSAAALLTAYVGKDPARRRHVASSRRFHALFSGPPARP